jgi:hypothetical protein
MLHISVFTTASARRCPLRDQRNNTLRQRRFRYELVVTGVALAGLIATPALAAKQNLNRNRYWDVIPTAQIFPPRDAAIRCTMGKRTEVDFSR